MTFKSLIMEGELIVEGTGVPLTASILKTYNLEEYIKTILGVKKVKFSGEYDIAEYKIEDYPDTLIRVTMTGGQKGRNDWQRGHTYAELIVGNNKVLGIITKNKSLIPDPSEAGIKKHFELGLKKQKSKFLENVKGMGKPEEPKKWKMSKVIAKLVAGEILSGIKASAIKSWYEDLTSNLIVNNTSGHQIKVSYESLEVIIVGGKPDRVSVPYDEENIPELIKLAIKAIKDGGAYSNTAIPSMKEVEAFKKSIRNKSENQQFQLAQDYLKEYPGLEDFIKKSQGINSPVEWLAFTH